MSGPFGRRIKKKTEPYPLDKIALRKERSYLIKQNYRDNNRLKYSVQHILETLNPMPPGEKRNAIIKLIKSRKKELEKIEILLHRLKKIDANNSQ